MWHTLGIVRPHLATLVDDFRRHAAETAVVAHRGNRELRCTYGELATASERFAAELIRRDISRGERVILWGENGAEWISAFFGCVLRGVLVVPLDAAGGADFANRVVAETRPRLLVGDESRMAQIDAALPRIAFEHFPAALPASVPTDGLREPSLDAQTPLQILFTSGTTSEPKGIVHTHGNILASLDPIEREMQKYLRYERIFHPLRFLHTLPLSHVFGQFMGLWIPPLMGAEVHFESRLQSAHLMELIRRHRISVLAAVPRVLELLRVHLDSLFPALDQRRKSLRGKRVWHRWWALRDVHRAFGFKFWAFVCGGASLPAELERFWSELGFALIQGYGMTETAALITLNHPFHIARGTIGKPLPGREVRIGEDGEVMVRGAMVASSRWQNGAIRTLDTPWLATGDLVQQESGGEMRFVGRKSEVIVTAAGLNIHPEDVEAALNQQPGVQASAVVSADGAAGAAAPRSKAEAAALPGTELRSSGSTEATRREPSAQALPVAVLLFRGTPEQAQAAVDAANATLAEYQRVRRWLLWPQLDFPRSGIGKIQRRKVAQWVAAQLAATNASTEGVDPLSARLAVLAGSAPVHLPDDARLNRDLHMDSLARVQLQTELEEQLGIGIGDEEFEHIATVGQLRTLLGMNGGPSGDGQATHRESEASALPVAGTELRSSGSAVAAAHREPAAQALPVAGPKRDYRYPRWPWNPVVKAVRVLFLETIMRPLVWLLAAPRVLRPLDDVPLGQVLLISNHVTAYDGALVLYALPGKMRRNVAAAMSGEMLEDYRHGRNQGNWPLNLLAPFAYWLLTALFNVFPLPRGAGFRSSFDHAGAAMDRGYHVLVFPEGHRSNGTLQPFRSGIGLLAQESRASILPIAVGGLGDLKRRGRGWFRSGRIFILSGELITPNPALPPDELTRLLHARLESLLREAEAPAQPS